MKKSFAKFAVCTAMLAFVFTGCTLFKTDEKSYYNQIVATTSTGYEVTLREMDDLFKSSGYQYLSQGYSASEAFEETIKGVVNRKIIFDYVDNLEGFDEKYEWRALQNTYDEINTQIQNYENIAKKEIYNEESVTEQEEEKETNSTYILTKYESVFDVDENGHVIFKAVEENNDEDTFPAQKPGEFKYTSAGSLETAKTENLKGYKVFVEGKRRYFKAVSKYYEGYGEKDLTEQQLLQNEIDRIYKIKLENEKFAYLQKYFEEVYSKSDEALNKTKQEVYDYYTKLYTKEQEKFDLTSNFATYANNELNASKTTITTYHPESGELFYVSHILLQFEEEDQKELERLKKAVENDGATQTDVDNFRETCYARIRVSARDLETGIVPEGAEALSATQIMDMISGDVSGLTNSHAKMEKFAEYIYMFNEDPGIMNSVNGYVIPTEHAKNVYGLKDSMVSEFANTARELRGLGSADRIGNFSSLVKSEYGYHIIMYLGDVQSPCDEAFFNDRDAVIENLFNSYVRNDANKTYLDYYYENAVNTSNDYNQFIQDIIDTATNDMNYHIYKSRYKKEVKKYK